jgi:DNA-binding MarR family transcriptional regulator
MTEATPPPSPSAAGLRGALRDLVRAQAQRDRARAAAHGLAPAGAHALEVLGERGAVSLRALAAALCVDDSTASRTVGLLEDRGYLARSADPRDGRAILVALTAAGRALESRLRDDALRDAQATLSALDPADPEAGVAFLRRLAAALAAEPG